MAHRIEVSPAAARQLRKIDRRVLPRIAEKIDSLASEDLEFLSSLISR